MKKILKGFKEFIGAADEDEDLMDEFEMEKKDNHHDAKKSDEHKHEIKMDTHFSPIHEEQKQPEEDLENCQTIFIDPKTFTDCKKIANYIKEDRMVTLNLEYLDSETAQRMMDFIMGAMLIKGASFIEISKKVYTSVPKAVKVHYDGKKNVNDRAYMNLNDN